MSKTFTAICVTGPKDGMIVECREPWLRVAVQEEMPATPVENYDVITTMETTNIVRYTHRLGPKLNIENAAVTDLWVPEEMTTEAAFSHIFNSYHMAKR